MEQCNFTIGDLVTFKSEFFVGLVQDVKVSDTFGEADKCEIKVLWVDYKISFWCLECALKKL
jgi:hypothetical protein